MAQEVRKRRGVDSLVTGATKSLEEQFHEHMRHLCRRFQEDARPGSSGGIADVSGLPLFLSSASTVQANGLKLVLRFGRISASCTKTREAWILMCHPVQASHPSRPHLLDCP